MKDIQIIGMGPAGLMAGTMLLERGFSVEFYDHKPAPGRKFLVAGHGGFNLTNNQEIDSFIDNYDHDFIKNAVQEFTNTDLRTFLQKIGIETYVGSSGKIFPLPEIKPITVLKKWLEYIQRFDNQVEIYYKHKLVDFDSQQLVFEVLNEKKIISRKDKLVFALGGASWKQTGSTAEWIQMFEKNQIPLIKFQSSNAGMETVSKIFQVENQGKVIKNCQVNLGEYSKLGEIVVTEYGFEGSPIYFLNKAFRKGNKTLKLDLKPMYSVEELQNKITKAKSISQALKELKIPVFLVDWLKKNTTKEQFTNVDFVLNWIKSVTFEIEKLRPIDESISTVGGVSMDAVNADFSLKSDESIFIIGEMLDWDAPTGGYLLQACFSMGVKMAQSIN